MYIGKVFSAEKCYLKKFREFMVVLVETADLLMSLDVNYSGAHPVMYLRTRTAKWEKSCCLTDGQRKSFSKLVM